MAGALRPRHLRGARHDRVLVLPLRDAQPADPARAPPASRSPGTTCACSIRRRSPKCRVGAEGMLCIPRHDPGLMLGYWNQPEETARMFHGDWFLTGDYARRDADGYVWFLGRRDDLINTLRLPRLALRGGARAEGRIPRSPTRPRSARRSGRSKVVVAAYVVPRRARPRRPRRCIAFAREHVAAYKAPRSRLLGRRPPAHAQRQGAASRAGAVAGARGGARLSATHRSGQLTTLWPRFRMQSRYAILNDRSAAMPL